MSAYHRQTLRPSYRLIAAALAMLIVLLSLAGVSPALHSALHGHATVAADHHEEHGSDHSTQTEKSESHYCGVTALHSGAISSIVIPLPIRSDVLSSTLPTRPDIVWHARVWTPQSARDPPTLIVV